MERQYNLRSPAVKRLMREAQELREPTEIFYAQPLEDNLFEWHFTIRGPSETDFDGGVYHGRIILPPEYPMKPPSIILLTPNGRFELFKKICLSISGHHPESWQPSWSIRTALLAIIGFMPTHGSGAIGALDYTPEERKVLAKKSREWKCSECGAVKDILKPLTDASKSDSQEAKELASQIDFQGEKQNGSTSSEGAASATATQDASGSEDSSGTSNTAASGTTASTGNSATATNGTSNAANGAPASPMGPTTNFPFPPPFNPAMFGARMPMMPGFMPPMMPQFGAMPGMNASAAASGQSAFPQTPHPLIAAQMSRMHPFWPMMNQGFQNQAAGQAGGQQRSFQQMMEMMQRMQHGNSFMNNSASQTSVPTNLSQQHGPSNVAPAAVTQSTTSTAAANTSPSSASSTSSASASKSPTSSVPSTSTSSTSASTSATSPSSPASGSPTPKTSEPQSVPLSDNTASTSTTAPTTPSSGSGSDNENELRQRRPIVSSSSPSLSNTATPNHPLPNVNPVNQNFMSAELPPARTRSDNPFVVFLIFVLGLAILALIIRRVYKFNLWNYDY